MVDTDNYGFPFLLTGDNEQAPMPHGQSHTYSLQQWFDESRIREINAGMANANIISHEWKSPQQRKLDRAKAIAAEVCARRFPVTKIPKEQQE